MAAGDWKDLLTAIENDDMELVRYHVREGVKLNHQHPELLTTPLIESISHQRLAIAEYLLASGADPTLKAGFSDDSPLRVAKRTKNKALVELVRAHLPAPTSTIARILTKLKSQ